ncbi:MAG TPA: NusA-like transcription termination signal-binding factor [Thermoplasmatales archaeon]|nr:NusA-like transcription termination signal-binding factor [Thermoplasmatales archaeon]
MGDISISTEAMKYIRMASDITMVDILDCLITEDRLVFVVRKGDLGAAIGRKASNLRRLESLFKKNIKFVEYHEDKVQFIRNLCKPFKAQNITFTGREDAPIVHIVVKPSEKSKLIGRNGRNIELIRELARRHHSIKDVQVK